MYRVTFRSIGHGIVRQWSIFTDGGPQRAKELAMQMLEQYCRMRGVQTIDNYEYIGLEVIDEVQLRDSYRPRKGT